MSLRVILLLVGLWFAPLAPAASPKPLESALVELTADPLFSSAQIGIQVVDVETGEELFARDADQPMVPASTAKVITAATALRTLGPAYRFTTSVLADARPDRDGVVQGDLYVRGGGDPTLVIEKLWKLVGDLELAGVRAVRGDVVFDDTLFTADTALPGWDKAEDLERGPAYFPRLSALSLNFNAVAIAVRPGASPGDDAVVRLETDAGDYAEVVGAVRTGPPGSRRSIRIVREVRPDGGMRYTVRGSIPARGDLARYYRTVEDPTAHFMAVFSRLLTDRGIAVEGSLRRGTTPDEAVAIAEVQSRPLAAILMDMNKFSSNYIAELVLKTVGAAQVEGPGSTEAGLEAARAYLGELGVEPDQYHLVNGSGLSRDARLSPSAINAVLLDMAHDDRVGPEFAASLSIAGWDGTLADRLEDHAGLLRGKTGTIGGVHCLAGYMTAGDGRKVAFAFLVNRVPGSLARVRRLHDRFATALFAVGDGSVADGEPGGDEIEAAGD